MKKRTHFLATMSKEERSVIVYAETCLVDRSGLMAGARLNDADRKALDHFQALGMLTWGRIPHKLIKQDEAVADTHWVTFKNEAWAVAHALRRMHADQSTSTRRRAIDEGLAERAGTAEELK